MSGGPTNPGYLKGKEANTSENQQLKDQGIGPSGSATKGDPSPGPSGGSGGNSGGGNESGGGGDGDGDRGGGDDDRGGGGE